jgi:hypothetical protein
VDSRGREGILVKKGARRAESYVLGRRAEFCVEEA